MGNEKKASKKPSLNLLLKRRRKGEMPKRGISLPSIDYRAIKEAANRRDKLQKMQDEIHYPLFKSRRETIGITKDQWERIGEQEDALYKKYQEEILAQNHPLAASGLPQKALCRKVTVWECQQKVCIDHPVPIDVDEFWSEGDRNAHPVASFNGNHVTYRAGVSGSSYRSWGMYHRRTKESAGAIALRASTLLAETAKVRQVGIAFDGSLLNSKSGIVNGLFLDGQCPFLLPSSFGDGRQTITWQVSVETPSGTLTRQIPDSETSKVYNDPPRAYQDYANPYLTGGTYSALPPSRVLDLNQTYPAGTFFLIEARVSHWLQACGKGSFSMVFHGFDAQPYINLESCSWQWPS